MLPALNEHVLYQMTGGGTQAILLCMYILLNLSVLIFLYEG